jgi:hypothetical protein
MFRNAIAVCLLVLCLSVAALAQAIENASRRTIGHAKGVKTEHAAAFFFFFFKPDQ